MPQVFAGDITVVFKRDTLPTVREGACQRPENEKCMEHQSLVKRTRLSLRMARGRPLKRQNF